MSSFTLDTYNASEQGLADYFNGIGARTEDINKAFSLVGEPGTLSVLELGCGDGRDAAEIAPRVRMYLGTDYSDGLLKIAKLRKIKNAEFKTADMRELAFDASESIDVIFAFASLLHLSKDEIAQLFQASLTTLKSGGIWYISLKYRDSYGSEVKEDDYGKRLFYFYNPDEIVELAGKEFSEVYRDFQTIGDTKWFTLALRRTPY